MAKRLVVYLVVVVLLLSMVINAWPIKADSGDVIINEIMKDPQAVSDANGEWFELFNPTGSDIDINGWTIMDNDSDSHVINNSGALVIPACGYLVLGCNANSSTNGGVSVDYVYGSQSSWAIANGADEIILLDGSYLEIDRVEYDDGITFPDPTGASMALRHPALDNGNGLNWCTASTPYGDGDFGTPGAENDCVPIANPITQMVMMLDGSGSITTEDWHTLIDGLAEAVNSSDCVPQDNSVELTVIQFGTNARLEVGPVVINGSSVESIVADILDLKGMQMAGLTCTACAICLAQDVLLNHPDSHFDPGRKQALNLVTDGQPTRCNDCESCTGAPDWECDGIICAGITAEASALAARNSSISLLQMIACQDEFDAEFIGTQDTTSDWLKNDIVWPEQADGDGYYAPPFDKGPGWVRVVANASTFADTICEKFQQILEGEEEAEEELDFGDAPDSYGTLLASNGARHTLLAAAQFSLGPVVDTEPDGQPSALADGDDLNGIPDDEDGVTFPAPLVQGDPAAQVTVNVSSPSGGMLDAWIDFNGNGVFDHPAEHLWGATSQVLVSGSNPLTFAVPGAATPGSTYARFRLSINGDLPPMGLAPDGEVEDYQVEIIEALPIMTIDKDVVGDPPVMVMPGGTVQYTINVTNTGTADALDVSIWDTLPAWFTYASTDSIVDTGATRWSTADPTPGDTTPLWGYWDIPSGDSVVITFTADVDLLILAGTYQNNALADGDNFEQIDDIGSQGQDPGTPPGQDPAVDEDVFVQSQPPPPSAVPTLSQWGMIAMGLLFAAFLVWSVRRRWVVSASKS